MALLASKVGDPWPRRTTATWTCKRRMPTQGGWSHHLLNRWSRQHGPGQADRRGTLDWARRPKLRQAGRRTWARQSYKWAETRWSIRWSRPHQVSMRSRLDWSSRRGTGQTGRWGEPDWAGWRGMPSWVGWWGKPGWVGWGGRLDQTGRRNGLWWQ